MSDSRFYDTVAFDVAVTNTTGSVLGGPVRLVWGMKDPILGPSLKKMKTLFPAAPVTETDAGHFLQEEVPMTLAEAILQVL